MTDKEKKKQQQKESANQRLLKKAQERLKKTEQKASTLVTSGKTVFEKRQADIEAYIIGLISQGLSIPEVHRQLERFYEIKTADNRRKHIDKALKAVEATMSPETIKAFNAIRLDSIIERNMESTKTHKVAIEAIEKQNKLHSLYEERHTHNVEQTIKVKFKE